MPTYRPPNGNHLQVPPLQLASQQGVCGPDIRSVHVKVVAALVLAGAPSLGQRQVRGAPYGGRAVGPGSVDGGGGSDMAAGVSAERVQPSAKGVSLLTVVVVVAAAVVAGGGCAHAEDAALRERGLLGAEVGQLDIVRQTHCPERGGPAAGPGVVQSLLQFRGRPLTRASLRCPEVKCGSSVSARQEPR